MSVPGAFGRHVSDRCDATGKVRFGPSMADEKIRQMRLVDPQGHLLRRYRCDACSWWHVGHDRRSGGRP